MAVSLLEIAARVDQFFMGTSAVHDAMRRLTKALQEMQIPFAVAGAMAANAHGHKRTTSDVDILIRREDLQRFKERYLGLGWSTSSKARRISGIRSATWTSTR